jgi:hypothetical protein
MGQFHYNTLEEILKDNGVKSCKQTLAGLIAIHKRNSVGGYYWKYFKFHSHYEPGYEDGYYYSGSTERFEAE